MPQGLRTHLVLRLALHGCANRPFYRLVVMRKHLARSNEKIVEQLGSYDPMLNRNNEKVVALNFDRINHWIANGAVTTPSVEKIFGLCGYFPIHPMSSLRAKRNREAKLAGEQTTTADIQE